MRKFLRILSIILLVLWMGLIFFFSSQTADDSSQTSGQVIEIIAEKIYPEYEQMTEIEREELVSSLQFIVRKSTHIGAFAVLGFLAFLTFISYVNLRFGIRIFWAAALSLIYAASDEFHQRFVSGRSCELRDFLLDAIGITAAILICTLFVKIVAPLRRKTAFAGMTKKALISLNNELYEKLDLSFCENKKLEDQLTEKNRKIEELQAEIQWKSEMHEQAPTPVLEPEIQENEPQIIEENSEETEKTQMKLSDEIEYASKVIGECVVEVTKVCNKLTATEQDATRKELVNLALGRNEVLKAEVLKIIKTEVSFEEKKNLIEEEKRKAYDYFDSIIAQMC